MKVFFTASMRGKKAFGKYYNTIYSVIGQLGYKHIDDLIFEDSETSFYNKLEKDGKKSHIDFFNKTILNLKSSDINMFECSLPSLGIGYQVEKSLELNKPTVILYLKNHVPHFLIGENNDKLVSKEYTEKNLNQTIEEAISIAKERSDKRFNFFISPKLLSYLELISKEQGITKSTFIRSLILNHMKTYEIKKV